MEKRFDKSDDYWLGIWDATTYLGEIYLDLGIKNERMSAAIEGLRGLAEQHRRETFRELSGIEENVKIMLKAGEG